MKISQYLMSLFMLGIVGCSDGPEAQNRSDPADGEVEEEGVRVSNKFREVKFGETSDFIENLERQGGPNASKSQAQMERVWVNASNWED